MDRKLRCLVIAPRTIGSRQMGGDTYTDMLLRYPPPGVAYIHHDDLVKAGKASRKSYLHHLFYYLGRLGILPYFWVQTLVTEESFDLVHCYGYAVHLDGRPRRENVPLIYSACSSHVSGLTNYKGWSPARVRRYGIVAASIQKIFRVYDALRNPGPTKRLIFWSEFARRDHAYGKADLISNGVIIPPAIEIPPQHKRTHHQECRLLMVGSGEFRRKGGLDLLAAFAKLRQLYGDRVTLTLVGNFANEAEDLNLPGVKFVGTVPHFQLLQEIYPAHDVFVLPSHAETYGVSILEAMACGLPCVATSVGAIPEIVVDGMTGFICAPHNPEQLQQALDRLIAQPDLRFTMGNAAYSRAKDQYAPEVVGAQIRAVYDQALQKTVAR